MSSTLPKPGAVLDDGVRVFDIQDSRELVSRRIFLFFLLSRYLLCRKVIQSARYART